VVFGSGINSRKKQRGTGCLFKLLASDLWHNEELLHCLSGVCEELIDVQALPRHILVELERSTKDRRSGVWKFSAATCFTNTLSQAIVKMPFSLSLSFSLSPHSLVFCEGEQGLDTLCLCVLHCAHKPQETLDVTTNGVSSESRRGKTCKSRQAGDVLCSKLNAVQMRKRKRERGNGWKIVEDRVWSTCFLSLLSFSVSYFFAPSVAPLKTSRTAQCFSLGGG
jgi:hypothetical protein